jgi:hypothetical protein
MKHTLTLFALMAAVPGLRAADPIQVPWNQVCRVAYERQLSITLANGDIVLGYCMSINVDEIALTSKGHKVVKIARSAFQRIQMKPKEHQLKSLGRGVRKGLHQGSDWLLSPYAPLGIVTIPATLAWGAVAAPFCLLGDLAHGQTGPQEIKVL